MAGLEAARKQDGKVVTGLDPNLIRKQVKIQAEAANRIVELTADSGPATGSGADTSLGSALLSFDNKAFDAKVNPVRIE